MWFGGHRVWARSLFNFEELSHERVELLHRCFFITPAILQQDVLPMLIIGYPTTARKPNAESGHLAWWVAKAATSSSAVVVPLNKGDDLPIVSVASVHIGPTAYVEERRQLKIKCF
jgi:hypothetical protein